MEDATAISYWCHVCSRSVDPIIQGEIINCNFCQSGFVEEMDETPDQLTNDDHPHHQAAESLWAPILLGMMSDHDQNARNNQTASESNAEDDDDDDNDDDDEEGHQNNDGGEFDLERHLEEIMRRRRRHSAAILDLLQGIRAGLSVESENSSDDNNNNNNNQDSELVVLINTFNQRIRVQDSSVDASSVPSGSLGDYFIGPGFEMLLQRLAENDPNRYGTPPATKEAVESLETVRVVESLVQCTVCLDDFEVGVEAKEMPCKHKFHSECLLPWLELHSSCPVCRYLLPAGDDDGEAKTDAETSSNVSMENNGTSVDSSSNNPSVND